ncbi:MAG: molybdopterin molybdenumtransferase MoeA, partial [Magnetococcales bacterium]|nr:molybdopterin molybdenumtransferase MoeA [Magnetococcales bacterium]
MIRFAEAKQRVLDSIVPLDEEERVPCTQARGRVLARAIHAPHPVPNHDNSGMDGFAVRLADLSPEAETRLTVVADLPAGSRLTKPLQAGEAVRIMTGAPIPPG